MPKEQGGDERGWKSQTIIGVDGEAVVKYEKERGNEGRTRK